MKKQRLALAALLGALGAGVPAPSLSAQSADFLFRRPWVSLGVRVGYAIPRAESDVFDDTRDLLTVERSDFHSGALGGELAVRATERIDVAAGLDWSRSETRSEFRDWVEEGPTPSPDDDLPITQTTTFQRISASLSVKGYLWERGRSVSRFAWIPARWSPYAGLGVGMVWYDFEQVGDFVNFETLEIRPLVLDSSDRAPSVHVLAGADFSIRPRFVLTGEARYTWARADMDPFHFSGFDKIDLSGLQLTAGAKIRF